VADLRVHDLGESRLLGRLQAFCPPGLVGDDGAVMAPLGNHALVVTADMLVDGVHFSLGLTPGTNQTTSPRDVGWRAIAANLSDLAAMGALPLGLTVSLGLRGDLPVAWVEDLYGGMGECLGEYGGQIVGGDVCRSPVVTVAIAAFGTVAPDRAIRRHTAAPGDVIVVTGFHGAARAGLELLLRPETGVLLGESECRRLVRQHRRPRPRLDVVALLSQISPAQRVTGMDSSDGLADAIVQICRASGVGAQIHRQQIPILPSLEQGFGRGQALEWALYGGEDFELVLCLSGATASTLVAHLGDGASIIGTVTATDEVLLVDTTGVDSPVLLSQSQGFQHF